MEGDDRNCDGSGVVMDWKSVLSVFVHFYDDNDDIDKVMMMMMSRVVVWMTDWQSVLSVFVHFYDDNDDIHNSEDDDVAGGDEWWIEKVCSVCLSTSSARSLLYYSRDGNLLNSPTNQYSCLFHVHDNDDDHNDDEDDDVDKDDGPQLHPWASRAPVPSTFHRPRWGFPSPASI